MSLSPARIIEQRSHLVGKLHITEHFFEVPRDYTNPASGTLRIFARSARKHKNPVDPPAPGSEKERNQLPWLLYLQGGPGYECSSPQNYPFTKSFLDKGYQMLYLDQRGTGLSSPISPSTLGLRGDASVQANYLRSFRAPSIVRDAEAIRLALTSSYPAHKKKWSLAGQSFGGFCAVTYLSTFPEALREAFLMGGVPPLMYDAPNEVYMRLWKRVSERNKKYYEKYPEDVERVKTIVRFLRRFGESTVRLPSEGMLSARRFLQMGLGLGYHGGADQLHDIVLRAYNELATVGHLTRQTADIIDRSMPFDNNVLYAILHEPCYCQGKAPNWSAEHTMKRYPEFDLDACLSSTEDQRPVYFTGEMVFPWMLDQYSSLRALKAPAQMLAEYSEWPKLYDLDQLRRNEVPTYAAIYMDDMYVDFDLSIEATKEIQGLKYFVTNLIQHDGLRSREEQVLGSLFKLRDEAMD